jgi:plastocyanin
MRLAGLTILAALAAPATASADVTIQAVDGANVWSAPDIRVKVGEKVTWRFAGTTLYHNVRPNTGPWGTFGTTPAIAGPDAEYTFTTPETYTYFCELHKSTMIGTITVLDATGAAPPPPPPPPLSEQPWTNDAPAPPLEVRDTVAPKLDRVKVTRARRAAKVRVRLSEAGKVAVALARGGKVVKRRTVEVRKGTSSFTVKGLRKGTYRVKVTAADLAGNAAKSAKRARITVR